MGLMQHAPSPTQVCRLAMLTLLAVFKDLLPAYRIRRVVDEEENDKAIVHSSEQRCHAFGLL